MGDLHSDFKHQIHRRTIDGLFLMEGVAVRLGKLKANIPSLLVDDVVSYDPLASSAPTPHSMDEVHRHGGDTILSLADCK